MDQCEFIRTHQRLLYSLAHKHFTYLPAEVRVVLDLDDLYQEACQHALKVSTKFDHSRGATMVTFLYGSVNNRLNSVVTAFLCPKRYTKELVPIDDAAVRGLPALERAKNVGAEGRIDTLLQRASPALVSFLREYVFGGALPDHCNVPTFLNRKTEEVAELRMLASALNVRLTDFTSCRGATVR